MSDGPASAAPLLTVKQLAARLSLSTKTVYGMARAGKIPSLRAPGERTPWRFDLAEVEAALRQHRGA